MIGTVTTRLRFTTDQSKHLYTYLIDNYQRVRDAVINAWHKTPAPGHKLGPQWRYIRVVSLFPLVAYASFATEYFIFKLLENTEADQGLSDSRKVTNQLAWFREQMPNWGTTRYLQTTAVIVIYMARAIKYCSSKLGRIGTGPHDTQSPPSQWLIALVSSIQSNQSQSQSHTQFGIDIKLVRSVAWDQYKEPRQIKRSFNTTSNVEVLILLYLAVIKGSTFTTNAATLLW